MGAHEHTDEHTHGRGRSHGRGGDMDKHKHEDPPRKVGHSDSYRWGGE